MRQPYLPELVHGRTNMESGIISLYEYKWSIERIAEMFKVSVTRVKEVLTEFGYLRPESK